MSTDKDFLEADNSVRVAYELAKVLGVACSGKDWDQILAVVTYCKFDSVDEARAGLLHLIAAVVENELAQSGKPARLILGNRGDSMDLLAYAEIVRREGGA